MPLASTVLVKRIGQRNSLIFFTFILCVGQGLFAYGGFIESMDVMVAGRAIFGIGCESMYVGQSAIITEWFINHELGFAIAMISCVPLLGSFVNGAVSPYIYEETLSFGKTFMVGFYLCLLSFFIVVVMACIDYTASEHDQKALEEFKKKKQEEREAEIKKRGLTLGEEAREDAVREYYRRFR